MIRFFDILFSLLGLVFGLPVLLLLTVIGFFDTGSPVFRQTRVGRSKKPFTLVKFRTMRQDTASVATHLADASAVTPLGSFLRKTKLDELPQLCSILVGHMSFVGPRPALFNQDDLIDLRTRAGVHVLTPGLTGWAQVHGRDELPIPEKVELDKVYLQKQSWFFDLQILLRTFVRVLRRDGVVH
jgi:O-antigen biosynthesis protein WbqP